MDATPDVSIIIPTFNRPNLLPCAIASALGQIGATIEVIVVDDGSEPPAVVADSPSIVLVRTENRGASAARNTGLARARGEHVLFLDSDDWLEPDAVSVLMATMRRSGAALAFGRWRNVHEGSSETDIGDPPTPYADGAANAIACGWVLGSFLLKRSAATQFDPALVLWEVVAFECESLSGGQTVAGCEAVVVNILQHTEAGRISIEHDHFEPLMTARAFAGMKEALAHRQRLNAERIAAFNARLLPCLHVLLRDRRAEARDVFDMLDRARVRAERPRFASFEWCVRWWGFQGAKWFVAANRALGR